MKNNLVTLAITLFSVLSSTAQQDGTALVNTARKALAAYIIDSSGNAAKLEEARNQI